MEIFKQDYRLRKDDLNYAFYADSVAYPYAGLTYKYSPYWVRYELGRSHENNLAFEPFGSLFRIPEEISTGTFRPNFIIGYDWYIGLYKIRWKIKKTSDSNIEYIDVPFRVTTEGIYNQTGPVFGGFLDLPAGLDILD